MYQGNVWMLIRLKDLSVSTSWWIVNIFCVFWGTLDSAPQPSFFFFWVCLLDFCRCKANTYFCYFGERYTHAFIKICPCVDVRFVNPTASTSWHEQKRKICAASACVCACVCMCVCGILVWSYSNVYDVFNVYICIYLKKLQPASGKC